MVNIQVGRRRECGERGILPPRQPLSFSDEPEGCLIQGGFFFLTLSCSSSFLKGAGTEDFFPLSFSVALGFHSIFIMTAIF